MAIDPKWFVWCRENDIHEGDIIRFENSIWTVEMIWFGQEETLRVRNTKTKEIRTIFPAEGIDTGVEKVLI